MNKRIVQKLTSSALVLMVCASAAVEAQAGVLTTLGMHAFSYQQHRHAMNPGTNGSFSGGFDINKALNKPNPSITPGALNPEVTQDTLGETVCRKRGGLSYSKQVRPPMEETNIWKREVMAEYGYPLNFISSFELDHFIPISLGGAPRAKANLWVQPWKGQWSAVQKDALEYVLYRMVCAGEVPLSVAQNAIGRDWVAAYNAYVPSHPQYVYKGGN